MRTTLPRRCLTAAALLCVVGCDSHVYGQPAWTVLSPTENVYCVSSSAGDDGNPGTLGAPVRTLARGYTLLRDGHADWLLLKAGDTWNESFPSTFTKSARSVSAYMVVGAYGGGVRPRLRVGSPVCYGGTAGGSGLAIVDLDVAPVSPGSGYAALTFFQPWSHILIEGCSIVGFPVNIVAQEVGAGRINDIKIRYCTIADSWETGGGHSQGIFMGSCDNWLIEGCVIDNNARNQNNIFDHGFYCHETCGPGILRECILSRNSSHGAQQRPGGTAENNLCIQNGVNLYQGRSSPGQNYFRYNVAIDARNINNTDTRGFGFVIGGADVTTVEYNLAAHQVSGSDAVIAFNFDGIRTADIHDNFVYDWKAPANQGWASAFQWDGSGSGAVQVHHNRLYMPNNGVLSRHEGDVLSTRFNYHDNAYWTTNPAGGYDQFSWAGGSGISYSGWQARPSHPDTSGSTFGNPGVYDVKVTTYMGTGGIPEFIAGARANTRDSYDQFYSARNFNAWARVRVGMPANPSQSCYADTNADGTLNVLDFVAFMNGYAANDAGANCDGSTVVPVLNANDFQCFVNRYAGGCP